MVDVTVNRSKGVNVTVDKKDSGEVVSKAQDTPTLINAGVASQIISSLSLLTGDVRASNPNQGDLLIYNGSFWTTTTVTGDATLSNTGVLTIDQTAVSGISNVQFDQSESSLQIILSSGGQFDTVIPTGVTSLSFDTGTAKNSLALSNGSVFESTITLDAFTTSNLTEGTNLYYTIARANSAIDDRVTKSFVEALNISSFDAEATFTSDVVVQGNLTVTGTQTSIDTSTLIVNDAIITVASGQDSGRVNAGLEVDRGADANVYFLWNESINRWTITNDGSSYSNITFTSSATLVGNTAVFTRDDSTTYDLDLNGLVNGITTNAAWYGSNNTFQLIADNGDLIDTTINNFDNISVDNITITDDGSANTLTANRFIGDGSQVTAVDARALDGEGGSFYRIETASFEASNNTITFTRGDANTFDVTVSGGVTSGSLVGNTIILTKSDSSTVEIDINALVNDIILSASFNAANNTLTLLQDDGGKVEVDVNAGVSSAAFAGSNNTLTFTRTDATTFDVQIHDNTSVSSASFETSNNTITFTRDDSSNFDVTIHDNTSVSSASFETSNNTITFTRDDSSTFDVQIHDNTSVTSASLIGNTAIFTRDDSSTFDLDLNGLVNGITTGSVWYSTNNTLQLISDNGDVINTNISDFDNLTVDNINVTDDITSNTVTATRFIGDGTGLTGITATDLDGENGGFYRVESADYTSSNNTITFTRGDANTFDVTIDDFNNITADNITITDDLSSNTITANRLIGDGAQVTSVDATALDGESGSFYRVESASFASSNNTITFTRGDANTFDVTVSGGVTSGSLVGNTIVLTKSDSSTVDIDVNGLVNDVIQSGSYSVANNTLSLIDDQNDAIDIQLTGVANNSSPNFSGDVTVTGDLTVLGTTTTVDTSNVLIEDPILLLGKQNDTASIDFGFYGQRYSTPTAGNYNVALIWDESEDQFAATRTIDDANNSVLTVLGYADIKANNFVGQITDISNHSTSDLSEGTNLYHTLSRVNTAIDNRVTRAFVDNLGVNAELLDSEEGGFYRVESAAYTVANNTLTFTRGDANTFDLVLTGVANTSATVNTSTSSASFESTNNTITFTRADSSNFDVTIGGGVTSGALVGNTIVLTKSDSSTIDIDVNALINDIILSGSYSVANNTLSLKDDQNDAIDIQLTGLANTSSPIFSGSIEVADNIRADSLDVIGNISANNFSGTFVGDGSGITGVTGAGTADNAELLDNEEGGFYRVESAAFESTNNTITFTRGDANTFDVTIGGGVTSGALVGNNIVLTKSDSSTIDIDVNALVNDIILAGSYSRANNTLSLTDDQNDAIDITLTGLGTGDTAEFSSLVVDNNISSDSITVEQLVSNTITSTELEVNRDNNGNTFLGRAVIGSYFISDSAAFAHIDQATSTGYALSQTAAGTTLINSADRLGFRIAGGGTDEVSVTATGLGIGIQAPEHALHVTSGNAVISGSASGGGHLIVNNSIITDSIDATGTISANVFIGDGSQLTGVSVANTSTTSGAYTVANNTLTMTRADSSTFDLALTGLANTSSPVFTGTVEVQESIITDSITAVGDVTANVGNFNQIGIGVEPATNFELDVNGDINFTGSFYYNGVPVDFTANNEPLVDNGIPVQTYLFTGNGSDTVFNGTDDRGVVMTGLGTEGQFQVFLNGVRLLSGTDFTANSTHITFTEAPLNLGKIQVTSYEQFNDDLKVKNHSFFSANNMTTDGSASQQVVDTYLTTVYGGAKYIMQVKEVGGNNMHVAEGLVAHDGAGATITTYGIVDTGTDLGTFDVDINSGSVRLLFTPSSANFFEVKVQRTTLSI